MERPRRFGLVAAAVIALLVAACGGGGQTLHGTLEAPECEGGYDIVQANVQLLDGAGEIIGAATTSEQLYIDQPGNVDIPTDECVVEFTIKDVPEVSFYQIRIGTHDGPTYSLEEMQSFDWELTLTL